MEKELIQFEITNGENGQKLVSARELHEKLGVKTKFTDWIKNRIKKYDFIENSDFILVSEKKETNNPKNPYTIQTEYAITFDMAKELSMVENNELGKKCRKWFIEKENELKQLQEQQTPKLPTTYKEALQQLLAQVEENEKLIEENNKISLENQILNGEHFKWADKNLINALVRRYGAVIGNFGKAWTEFKKNLLYKHSININIRKTLALNNGTSKSKCKTLDMLHGEDEIQSGVETILSMCNEENIDVSEILVHAKEDYEKEN